MSNLVSVPVVQRTLLLAIALILLATPLFCQQAYVSRYDLFTGYTYLNSPKVSLPENGFHTQFGALFA